MEKPIEKNIENSTDNEVESEEIFEKLKKLLDDNNIKYNLLIHEGGAKTSEEVAKLRGKEDFLLRFFKKFKRIVVHK